MPSKVTIQNGQFQDAAGTLQVGTLVIQLSQDAVVSGTGQVAPKAISIVVTAGQAAATPVWGNDNLTPAGTTYTARLFDASGALVWGPENWSITGAGPIEINTLVPASGSVSYTGAVVLTPSGNQTITTNDLLPASGNTTQSLGSAAAPWNAIFRTQNGVLYANEVAGANSGTKINNAVTAIAGAKGVIVAEPAMAAGEGNQVPDNIVLVDYRGTAQSQGLRFNISAATSGNVRSKMLLQDNFDSGTIGLSPNKSSSTEYVLAYVDNPITSGTIEALNGTMSVNSQAADMTNGVICGIEGTGTCGATNGSPRNVLDIRGGTFNCLIGGNTSATRLASLVAQSPVVGGTGTATNQYSFIAEDVTASASSNDAAIWSKGRVRIDDTLSIRGGANLPASTGTNLTIVGNPGASKVGRIFVGDGTGWSLPFAKRTGSATTDLFTLNDNGNLDLLVGKITTYGALTTAGNGVSSIVASTSQKAETAADASVLSFTPPASAGSYRIRFVLSLSAANAATLGWTATWKDSNGTAQTPTNLALSQSGVAAPALTFTTSVAGNYFGELLIDTDASATAVVVKLTFSGTSFAGKATATIEKIV
jgi:hypothetical protein